MPFLMIRDDIVHMKTDAIVNPANENLAQGSGTSRAIYLAAGEKKLEKACRRIGHCDPGKAVMTRGFDLPAKYVIHAVGPLWMGGGHGEEELLGSAYRESLMLARKHHLKSIAFPLLSAGNYHYPKEQAIKTAVRAISDFLMEYEMLVYLVLYDRNAVSISKTLADSIDEYIDDHYVETKDEHLEGDQGYPDFSRSQFLKWEDRGKPRTPGAGDQSPFFGTTDQDLPFGAGNQVSREETEERFPAEIGERDLFPEAEEPFEESVDSLCGSDQPEGELIQYFGPLSSDDQWRPPDHDAKKADGRPQTAEKEPKMTYGAAAPPKVYQKQASYVSEVPKRKLDQLLAHMDETFSQMLLRLIDERGLKDSSVYRKANVDRRHFSKIRKDVNYAPNKRTVLAFAIALELTLDETKDLLMRAGFAFSSSSRFDVIVCFFIENRQYDIFEINEALFAYGQPLLGQT